MEISGGSSYLRARISEWRCRWKANRWRSADRKLVNNDELWRQLEETTAHHRVTWQWLKGHVGHPDNERCDRLAAAETANVRRNYAPEQLAALREAVVASRDPNRNQGNLF